MTLAEINRLTSAEFVALLGGIFEHSPWVAERAFAAAPFADLTALHGAMVAAVAAAGEAEQLALLKAHPDLAGKLARAGGLTDASTAEQASAGLDRLIEADYQTFTTLNSAYVARFGFPFIIAVRENTLADILASFHQRLTHDRAQEFTAALHQVGRIAWHRLSSMIEEA